MSRCLYNSSFTDFLNTDDNTIFGVLCDRYHGEALTTTREAWKSEISIMKDILVRFANKDGQIIFEYDIPRLGKRVDVVLLFEGIVFCVEFKVGESRILESDIDQVLDYALDLKNFHKFNEDRIIAPILVATNYRNSSTNIQMSVYDDRVVNPLVSGKAGVSHLISEVLRCFPNETSVNPNWIISPYAPTPTIIEAAKTLYENHSVENITRHEADKVSTDKTIEYILDVIQRSKLNQEKSICFVTGVPGAGKTLVGLDVAIKQTYQGQNEPVKNEGAVYTCLLWDADMRYENGEWRFYRFNGQTKWVEQTGGTESKQELMKYMLNAYRVLLTRARAGMVICVPEGNPNKNVSGFWEDSTRLPEYYDGTYQYLKSLGIEEI